MPPIYLTSDKRQLSSKTRPICQNGAKQLHTLQSVQFWVAILVPTLTMESRLRIEISPATREIHPHDERASRPSVGSEGIRRVRKRPHAPHHRLRRAHAR